MSNKTNKNCYIIIGILVVLLIGLGFMYMNDKKVEAEPTNNKQVILINPFEVPTGKLDASIQYWEACRDFLKQQPGYVSTKLHQSLKDDTTFQLVNIAVWESPEDFMKAATKMRKELGVPPVEGLKANPGLYKIVRE